MNRLFKMTLKLKDSITDHGLGEGVLVFQDVVVNIPEGLSEARLAMWMIEQQNKMIKEHIEATIEEV